MPNKEIQKASESIQYVINMNGFKENKDFTIPRTVLEEFLEEIKQVQEENEKYRKALWKIVQGESGETLWSVKSIARKVLE